MMRIKCPRSSSSSALSAVLVTLLSATSVLSLNGLAQTVTEEVQSLVRPHFDVVSIRPMKEGDNTPTHITNSSHNGYVKAVNVNLKALMEVAYDIPDIRMYGGPAWATTDKFSLTANADPKLDEQIAGLSSEKGKEIKRKMLAALLADRFKLAVHTEVREMPIYAMVIAKGGPRLGKKPLSGSSVMEGEDRISVEPGSDSLSILSYELSWRLGRPVIDRTGLQYRQALTLDWAEDDGASVADSSGPSVFTAIQEQLGLRLESARGPVPVLCIDHAERPSQN